MCYLHTYNFSLTHKYMKFSNIYMENRFLWVELQLHAICAQVSDYGIEEALQNIPTDINATYEKMLDLIDKKPPVQRELAKKALLFVAYAREPVSIDILALAIAVKHHEQSLDMLRSSISTEQMILYACGNLLAIDNTDSNHRRVRFIHFSVHEFFINHRSRLHDTPKHEIAHRDIAQMCMAFLLILYTRVRGYCTATESALANYILTALPHHLLAGNLNSLAPNHPTVDLALLLFEKGPPMLAPCNKQSHSTDRTFFTFSPSVLALMFNLPGTYQCYNPQILYGKQLDPMVLTWVYGKVNNLPTNFVQVSDNRLAMHYAIGQLDSVPVGKRLSDHQFPIEYSYDNASEPLTTFQNWGQQKWIPGICMLTPLYLVKSEDAAIFLLDRGASVNPQLMNTKLPNLLGHLSKHGNTKVLQLLLDNGAKPGDEAQGSALQSLAYDGNLEAIGLLLDNGVDVNTQRGDFGSALHAAARSGKVEAMRLLLDKGADVHAHRGEYGTPLQVAAYWGQVEAIQLLLNKGANVDEPGGYYGNALQAAAYMGQLETMRFLLHEGADANMQGGHYGNALRAATYCGNIKAMRLLLDNGADINGQAGGYENALHTAAYSGNIEAMRFLLDKGANVNVEGGEYGSALQAAAYRNQVDAIRLLLDEGADASAQGGKYGNALQAAAYRGQVESVRLLLDKGVDVNTRGGEYGNALQAATYRNQVKVMRLLLDKGADVNAQGGKFGNALQAAAYGGQTEPMQLLLTRRANVNAQGGMYGSPLQAAACRGQLQAMHVLLDKGADIHAGGGYYGNALRAAADTGYVEAKQLLLGAGARERVGVVGT